MFIVMLLIILCIYFILLHDASGAADSMKDERDLRSYEKASKRLQSLTKIEEELFQG